MRVVHVCLCGPVTDNWNYQENMLTKYQVKLGYEVTLIAPQWAWNSDGRIVKVSDKEYTNLDGVKMIRLSIKGKKDVMYKFKRYIGLYESIVRENPDIIFVHNVQFLDIISIAKYAKKNKHVKIFVDNHADLSNSARNWISKKIMHGIFWRKCAKMIEPYTRKFYGVLPSRVDFIKDIYKVSPDKVDLLVMGADDELVKSASDPEVRGNIRRQYGIKDSDFLIVSGGKIDEFKTQTLLLMEAVKKTRDKNIKLIVFGSVTAGLRDLVLSLSDGEKIQYVGWISSEQSYEYFSSAELVVFPGRHSVFWEQVVGQGIPVICKYWDGTTHIDLGGNVQFLVNDSVDEIYNAITRLINDKEQFQSMKIIAEENGFKHFSYLNIAKRSIQE